ncbi:hypothetical protein GGR54DRAFT_221137 [Hypoxylon sp. NC1633]|nr:hypothetical protein GGR54DRAFT_221137 [Hypoxylon sp. NC1633]
MMQHTPDHSTPGASSPSAPLSKPQRILACTLCQQRKVKCDRKFPCSNCVKSRAQCVQATANRPRRVKHRFPKQDLLERLRKYEELLNHHNIEFEPLHKDPAVEKIFPTVDGRYGWEDDQQLGDPETDPLSPPTTVKSEGSSLTYESKNFWRAMNQRVMRGRYLQEDDDESVASQHEDGGIVKQAWDTFAAAGHGVYLLFGLRKTPRPLAALHPDPVRIFRLWQIYLDNVNPILKVIHAPSLQARIVEAISDIDNVDPNLEALLFSIYCTAILSIPQDECETMFGTPKQDLLANYQSVCQQALLNCGFVRTKDRDCLTALFLYTISLGLNTDPATLSCMLGVSFRIARRMGLHSEAISTRCTPFEAEMRRRLWWSFILYDYRIGEMADYKSATLSPAWDCKIPLNVNDSDLRPDMKEAPVARENSTDMIYAVARAELGNFVRHSKSHLDFANPALQPVAQEVRDVSEIGELTKVEKTIEEKYLKFCDPGVPIHYISIWMLREQIARCHLVELYSRHDWSTAKSSRGHLVSDEAMYYAFTMLKCDTNIMMSPLTKGYHWLTHFHFQLPAYVHVIQELLRDPLSKHAEQAWQAMSDNFEARFSRHGNRTTYANPLFRVFVTIILPAWDARLEATKGSGERLATPKLVLMVQKLSQIAQIPLTGETEPTEQQPNDVTSLDGADFSMAMPLSMGPYSFSMDLGGQDDYNPTGVGAGPDLYPGLPGQDPLNVDLGQMGWAAFDWNMDQ